MAQPITHINGLRNAAVAILAAMDQFEAERQKFFALGGKPFIDPFFVATVPAPDPNDPTKTLADKTIQVPRTDLDMTSVEVADLINSYDAMQALLATGHRTNLTKAYR